MHIVRYFLLTTLWIFSLIAPPPLMASDCLLALTQPSTGPQVSHLAQEDVEEAAALESEVWGPSMAASSQKLQSRIKLFSSGQFKLSVDGKIVGLLNVQQINSADLALLEKTSYAPAAGAWADFTDDGFITNSHNANGDAFFMINITTRIPTTQAEGIPRSSLGEMLIRKLIQVAKAHQIKCIYGITRVNGFAAYLHDRPTLAASAAMPEYLNQVETSKIRDPALSFHLRMGAKLVRPVAHAMPEDHESVGYGALIVYHIH